MQIFPMEGQLLGKISEEAKISGDRPEILFDVIVGPSVWEGPKVKLSVPIHVWEPKNEPTRSHVPCANGGCNRFARLGSC